MTGKTTVHEAFIAELGSVRGRAEAQLMGETPLGERYPADMNFDKATALVNALARMRRDLSRALLFAEMYVGEANAEQALSHATDLDG